MEPSQSLPASSDRHTFVNLRVYDERDTIFTTAEILSAAAVTHKWCIPWAEAVSYEVSHHFPGSSFPDLRECHPAITGHAYLAARLQCAQI